MNVLNHRSFLCDGFSNLLNVVPDKLLIRVMLLKVNQV